MAGHFQGGQGTLGYFQAKVAFGRALVGFSEKTDTSCRQSTRRESAPETIAILDQPSKPRSPPFNIDWLGYARDELFL